ncbi:MAG: hypothetical protein NVS1B6_14520 [Steroidobacteraceae bacterium]
MAYAIPIAPRKLTWQYDESFEGRAELEANQGCTRAGDGPGGWATIARTEASDEACRRSPILDYEG